MKTFLGSDFVCRFAFLCVIVALIGCDDVAGVVSNLGPKDNATFWYIAKFQGVDYRSRDELKGLGQSLKQAQVSNDLNGISAALAAIGGKYVAVANQVDKLDSKDVDEDAIAYTQQFAQAYRDMGTLQGQGAEAAKARDNAKMHDLSRQMRDVAGRFGALKTERKELFNTLSKRYGGKNFDTME